MKFLYASIFFIILTTHSAQAQVVIDTPQRIDEVLIKAYLSEQGLLNAPASVSLVQKKQLNQQPQVSLVGALNTVSGLRMEERTPGSYRLSIRGSLLRSPFGVRNVKVYMDGLPLTDASGNTYLNVLDISALQNVEVLKGPDGSLFGANSGGVLLLNSQLENQSNGVKVNLEGGSYGLFRQNVGLNQTVGKHSLQINQAYQTADGYRDHSAMDRKFFQISDKFAYGKGHSFTANVFYADMDYQTPGGLIISQFEANPRASRPATPTLPSAEAQNIGIRNKMFFGGLQNDWKLSENFNNVTSVFGSSVDFKNPFITNFEQRYETNFGLRSYFKLSNAKKKGFSWNLNWGLEWQQSDADIRNFDNNEGQKGNPQALDLLKAQQYFVFMRYAASINDDLNMEFALSLNDYQFKFKNTFPLQQNQFNQRKFEPQLMPRVAISYRLAEQLFWRGLVSRGYSSPTIEEVRPSNNVINTTLEAETGWNAETGLRYKGVRASVDANIYRYQLSNSIVNRRLPNETDFFLNAGGTEQWGLEFSGSFWAILPQYCGFIRGVELQTAISFSKFKFRNYQVNQSDYSGNSLTGVPASVVVSSLNLLLPWQAFAFVQHNYTSKLPLNDGNTVYAPKYHLLQAKLGWQTRFAQNTHLNFYLGADNLLNQKYSLGNDLNAIGNRYYNPAAMRNFHIGMQLEW